MLNPENIADYAVNLADALEQIFEQGEFRVVLGGDCSILLGSLLALRWRGRYGLVFLDGLSDFWAPGEEAHGEAASMDLALVTGRGPQLSVLEYTFKNHRLFLTHTEVPPALESQGLGTALAHAALEYARQNELTVVAICPFVQEYVGSHPEYQSFVTTSVA